jgi:hypothetical protein
MTNQPHPCRLVDAQGTVVTAAQCHITPAAHAWEALVSSFDRPGQVVERCLLGYLRDIWVEFEDGVALPGRIERVYYDPKHGRVCRIRLSASTVGRIPVGPTAA